MEWKNIYRGFFMGASDLIPGVSGGTIALLLGIYDRFIEAINGLFSRKWKRHLTFLIPLGIGAGTAIVSLSKVINWLLKHHPGPLQFFFLGLILGVLPFLTQQADMKNKFRLYHYGILIVGAILVGSIEFLGTIMDNLSISDYVFLFFSGILASAAMILPGISGSMILLVIGAYATIIHAINNFQFDVIIVTGLGIVIGIVTMSKLINYFLNRYFTATFACVIGFVIGSLIIVFPGWPSESREMITSVATFALGLFGAYILGKVEHHQ
ncbi:putative membrane protein [Cerasibacillus quisquiliarum]|uniref:DUF368 domain-containing protein n=1 Tax=Cerasibacillus quisquiliarum TaxID=227865 RepID=A0A511V3I3_9BACI|nr:DUF368 domain-containing protein [Cerasibacillus quisquiliarum]MBB5147447.1 putative membrane protein [Cerasibacillus quisquiliarum]GEN32303.1 DUF368 domain-containing protein [Cerasibacillus quisquiliarum]